MKAKAAVRRNTLLFLRIIRICLARLSETLRRDKHIASRAMHCLLVSVNSRKRGTGASIIRKLTNIVSCAKYALGLAASGAALSALVIFGAASQQMPPNGRAIFTANCVTCHGAGGRGMRTPAEVGFDLPLPDFTDCSPATREADADWSSVIHRGGRQRALSRFMPAFGDALSDDEIDAV